MRARNQQFLSLLFCSDSSGVSSRLAPFTTLHHAGESENNAYERHGSPVDIADVECTVRLRTVSQMLDFAGSFSCVTSGRGDGDPFKCCESRKVSQSSLDRNRRSAALHLQPTNRYERRQRKTPAPRQRYQRAVERCDLNRSGASLVFWE